MKILKDTGEIVYDGHIFETVEEYEEYVDAKEQYFESMEEE